MQLSIALLSAAALFARYTAAATGFYLTTYMVQQIGVSYVCMGDDVEVVGFHESCQDKPALIRLNETGYIEGGLMLRGMNQYATLKLASRAAYPDEVGIPLPPYSTV